MANRNWASGGKVYSMHVKPVRIDMQFTVNHSDSAGKGITNLIGPCVANVFMNTSATPAANSPNPAAGTILIQLQDNYNQFLGMSCSITSPNSGSDVKIDNSALTAGVAYVITTLGNATLATWLGIGLPVGITPAVGVSFIATGTGGSGNTLTSRVQTAAAAGSGVFSLELVGNSQLTLAPSPQASPSTGAQLILQSRKDSSADAPAVAAIADGSVVQISLMFNDSSVQVKGQ